MNYQKNKQASKSLSSEDGTVMCIAFPIFTGANKEFADDDLEEEIKFYHSTFDEIIIKYGFKKIKENEGCYIAFGESLRENKTHAIDVIKASLEIQQFIAISNIERKKYKEIPFACKIGIHSPGVVTNSVENEKFSEDTLRMACLIKLEGEPQKINLSGTTYELIKDDFSCTYHGKIDAQNQSPIDMYFLDSEKYIPIFSTIGAENFIMGMLQKNLPPHLTYHGFHHTKDVLNAALQIAAAENINEDDLELLRIAVMFHDSGFTEAYQDHEERGCEIAMEYLPYFGFKEDDINCICGMIRATKIPQKPVTELERIICDADLDYLGRDDFYTIGKTLFEEFKTFDIVKTEKQWNDIQISFLEKHQYHTDYSKKEREPEKQKYLAALKEQS